MTIWHHRPTPTELVDLHVGTIIDHLGIEFTDVGDDYLAGRVPLSRGTRQPFGLLHGGASVVLAETLGSCAALFTLDTKRQQPVGQEINANHLRAVKQGWANGIARPIHLGRRSQVWGIEVADDEGKLVCVSRLTVAILDLPAERGANRG